MFVIFVSYDNSLALAHFVRPMHGDVGGVVGGEEMKHHAAARLLNGWH